ncbi:F-box only protein 7 [Stegostoma tigrinum]|uniref:F-box only protein 7 n=1 Tax=Stegostoma tigrinum TaxID=3053191 RepID=UPI00287009DA|nr:F-box only protein 7 [Stegostoma tigrinum]XP_048405009.2 F-box only protein 7 [Stegostoma tigrinum]
MKLRVRVQRQRGWVELEQDEPTLADLRSKIANCLLPSMGYSSDTEFNISLNGKDVLTDDQQTVTSIGIVSGDLICLILPDAFAPSASGSVSDLNVKKIPSHSNNAQIQGLVNGGNILESGHETDARARQQSEANVQNSSPDEMPLTFEETPIKYPEEPMLCSEAMDGMVPHSLEALYHSAECTNPKDALIVVLHLLMLEAGYIPQGTGLKISQMPEKWKNEGVYRLQYNHPLCEDGSATLSCIPMGNLVVVNATLKINENVKSVKRLQLLPASYVYLNKLGGDAANLYKDLQKLSCMFKDQLVYPLLASARQALNLPDVFGLVVLPLELKLRIFRLLDVLSILSLSTVCRDLYTATNDQLLWRFLYLRDFRDSRASSHNWKELYKEKYVMRSKTLHRIPLYLPPALPPIPGQPGLFNPFPFEPRQFYPPGVIGGEYDEHPQLPYRGDPINRFLPGSGPMPGTLPPFRPPFDPTDSLPGQSTGVPGFHRFPGRSTGGRSANIRRGII